MVATNSNGFKMSYDIIGDLKPKAMVGFGGYPTIPPVLAALPRGIPSMIHEQNSVMGRANRFLAPMVKAIAISFEDTKFLEGKLTEKSFLTGTPLRDAILEMRGGTYQPAQPGQPLNLLCLRRQPGGALLLRYHARGAAASAAGIARPDDGGAAMPRRRHRPRLRRL